MPKNRIKDSGFNKPLYLQGLRQIFYFSSLSRWHIRTIRSEVWLPKPVSHVTNFVSQKSNIRIHSRNFAQIDFIDLFGREEFPGVVEIDFFPDKYVEQVGIDMAAQLEFPQYDQRLR